MRLRSVKNLTNYASSEPSNFLVAFSRLHDDDHDDDDALGSARRARMRRFNMYGCCIMCRYGKMFDPNLVRGSLTDLRQTWHEDGEDGAGLLMGVRLRPFLPPTMGGARETELFSKTFMQQWLLSGY